MLAILSWELGETPRVCQGGGRQSEASGPMGGPYSHAPFFPLPRQGACNFARRTGREIHDIPLRTLGRARDSFPRVSGRAAICTSQIAEAQTTLRNSQEANWLGVSRRGGRCRGASLPGFSCPLTSPSRGARRAWMAGLVLKEPPEGPPPPEPSAGPAAAELISQGAEGRVYAVTFCGRRAVRKERFKKEYRHPALDERLTTRRLQGEARNLVKARKLGVRTPTLYAVDLPRRTLTMERISGTSMKDLLLSVTHSLRQQHHHHHQQQQQQQQQAQEQWGGAVMDPSGTNEISKVPLWGLEVARGACLQVATCVGAAIARLHDGGLIHGDLTTSNILLLNAPCPSAGGPATPLTNGSETEATGGETCGTGASASGVSGSGANGLAPGGKAPLASAAAPVAVLIDFGLSFNSTIPEDKAVDLYVLERALLALHSTADFMMDAILDSYRRSSKQWSATFNKLAAVRARGRKRVMVG